MHRYGCTGIYNRPRSPHILGKSLGRVPYLTITLRIGTEAPLGYRLLQCRGPARNGTSSIDLPHHTVSVFVPTSAAALPMTSPSIRNFSQLRGPPAACFSGGYPPRPPRPHLQGCLPCLQHQLDPSSWTLVILSRRAGCMLCGCRWDATRCRRRSGAAPCRFLSLTPARPTTSCASSQWNRPIPTFNVSKIT